MKKLLFILTISIFLLSCEKNYSCICSNTYGDEFGNVYGVEYTKWKDIKTTKNKAKNECDKGDFDWGYIDSTTYIKTDCGIAQF